MKTKLEQLTIAQFIDLACGDLNVLRDKRELPDTSKLARVMRDIVMEYETIANEPGVRTYISSSEDLAKSRMSLTIFTICDTLCKLMRFADVRSILNEYGLNAGSMDDERLVAEVQSRISRTKREISELEEEGSKEEEVADIRRNFDEQTAAMMSHFKFQIDIRKLRATEYAFLVARFSRDVKAMMKASKKSDFL